MADIWRNAGVTTFIWPHLVALVTLAVLGSAPAAADDLTPSQLYSMIQQGLLRVKPAVVLVTARIDADVTVDCGRGPVTVSPSPFVETGTGWFVDGRGYVITNAHVVDPAHRLPPWVTRELASKGVTKACVQPELAARGLDRGQNPDLEGQLRARIRLADVAVAPRPQVSVLLSNGKALPAQVVKFSAPLTLDRRGAPLPDSGRDLALLRVADGAYPALVLSENPVTIGHAVHIVGYPGVVLQHELLNLTASLEASVTNGLISGFKQDALGQDVYQTDAPAASGNSGGPAVGNRGNVIGVLTFVTLSASGESVQGFNFLIPVRDVKAFLQGTEVRPGESRFSSIWTAGLRDLDDGRYAGAASRLAEADALLSGLPDVKRALAAAQEKVKNPPPRPFPWAWAAAGMVAVGLGALGGAWGRRRWRRRMASESSSPSAAGTEVSLTSAPTDVERRRVASGQIILKEGAHALHEAYLIHSGQVEVRRNVDGGPTVVDTLGEGDLFGADALFRDSTGAATVAAVTDVELTVIKQTQLEWLIRNRPQLTLEILKLCGALVRDSEPPGRGRGHA